MSAANRIFFICRSKTCEAARYGRCTISFGRVSTYTEPMIYADRLNEALICVRFPELPKTGIRSFFPNWQVSEQKPGMRKIVEMTRKVESAPITGLGNKDFLEVTEDDTD